MANPDFPIRYNPFSSKQSPAKVWWEKWREWKQRGWWRWKLSRGGCHVVVVNTDLHLLSKHTLQAGNQLFFRSFKSSPPLTASFSSCLLIYVLCVCVLLFKLIDLFAVVSLQHYARATSSVLLIYSVSIRPGKPAALQPCIFLRSSFCRYCTCSSLWSSRFNHCTRFCKRNVHQSLLYVHI